MLGCVHLTRMKHATGGCNAQHFLGVPTELLATHASRIPADSHAQQPGPLRIPRSCSNYMRSPWRAFEDYKVLKDSIAQPTQKTTHTFTRTIVWGGGGGA